MGGYIKNIVNHNNEKSYYILSVLWCDPLLINVCIEWPSQSSLVL